MGWLSILCVNEVVNERSIYSSLEVVNRHNAVWNHVCDVRYDVWCDLWCD